MNSFLICLFISSAVVGLKSGRLGGTGWGVFEKAFTADDLSLAFLLAILSLGGSKP